MRFSGRRFQSFLALALAFTLVACVSLPAGSASIRSSRNREAFGAIDVSRSGELEFGALFRGGLQRCKGASQGGCFNDCAPGVPLVFRTAASFGPVVASFADLSFDKAATLVSRRVRLDE
jgi:hypothetical protein